MRELILNAKVTFIQWSPITDRAFMQLVEFYRWLTINCIGRYKR